MTWKGGSEKCLPGCTCGRHKDKHCLVDCTCRRHLQSGKNLHTPTAVARFRAVVVKEVVGYSHAHLRVKKLLPSSCENCGSTKNLDSCLKKDTPKERLLVSTEKISLGYSYSLLLEDYIRLCRSCHRKYDKGSIAA